MPLGVQVSSREAPPARGAETNISPWHTVGLTTAGPTDTSTKCRSLADWKAVYAPAGRATGNQLAYDAIDLHFREGGSTVHFAKAVDADSYDDALALLPVVPGQVSILDPAPVAAHWTLLDAHAQATNKRALYDLPPGATGDTVAELVTLSATLPQTRYGAAFGPWAKASLPGGASRDIPASALVAALIARADRTGNPNKAAAGRKFGLQHITGFAFDYSMDDVNTLNAVGINSAILKYGVLENYGFDTPVSDTDDVFGQFNCSRTEMYVIAQCASIGENYEFETIDGEGHLASDLASDIKAMLLDLYRVRALFGASPQEAFAVDITENTPDTANEERLLATLTLKLSKYAREVDLDLVFVPVNSTI